MKVRPIVLAPLALVLIGVGAAVANYAVTLGVGTNFGSIPIATVHYAQQLICDFVTPAQCVHVSAAGGLQVDGSAVTQPVSGNLTNISGTISLPTGASTSALQTTGNGTLTTIATNTGTVPSGAATSALQGTGNTSLGTIATNSGTQATAANQTTGNASLATIVTNTSSPVPAGANYIGQVSQDPCTFQTKINFAIATTAGTTQLVAPSGSTQVYVCSLTLISAAAATINFVGGTGATCTTGTPVAALGSTTAANGMVLAANGGLTIGGGSGTIMRTMTGGHGLCLIQAGVIALAGNITYVQQ